MTLAELITDLKAAGANENTVRLAMNCYRLGLIHSADLCDDIALRANDRHDAMADDRSEEPILYMTGKQSGAESCALAIRAKAQQ